MSDLENAVKLVMAAGLSTGHAENFIELMEEVLWQYSELRERERTLYNSFDQMHTRALVAEWEMQHGKQIDHVTKTLEKLYGR